MWYFPEEFDVIVVGAGHAGCEAALASARMGCKTLVLTMSLDTVAKMSCNPAIGGTAKGHIVREIDALGGEMGKCADANGIQFRMLNAQKGPAVRSPRAQTDRTLYQFDMKKRLEKAENLFLKQGTVEELLVNHQKVIGVGTKEGIAYRGKSVIISSGTFMRGLLHTGEVQYSGGRAGDMPSVGLSANLEKLGIVLGRLKTGTPPRVHRRSIDFSKTEEQPGEEGIYFSFDENKAARLPQVSCHITYTTKETKEIILKNLHRSAMYSGKIQSVGPRYCPSIEDKIVRFSDKERHQIFLEPEGLHTEEIYVNGVSSSLPFDVQLDYIHSIIGLEKAEITRPAYAIEYDYVLSGQIEYSLASKAIYGLFFAGQLNGTTGYEEAGAQGVIAGINAACLVQNKSPFILQRSEAYIGVMIDDLINKGVDEPYRMFTSRAEHRLHLRQDNADLRLTQKAYDFGLVSKNRYNSVMYKKKCIEQELERFAKVYKQVENKGFSISQLLSRPENSYVSLLKNYPDVIQDFGHEINTQIEFHIKYAGYIERQANEIEKLSHNENIAIPKDLDFFQIPGLCSEAKQKLSKIRPQTLGQASRIPGISPTDIVVIMISLKRS